MPVLLHFTVPAIIASYTISSICVVYNMDEVNQGVQLLKASETRDTDAEIDRLVDFHNEALNKEYAILGELSTAYCGTLAGGTFIGKISGGKTLSFKSAIIETGEDVMTDQIAGCIDETLGGANPVKRTVINFVIGGGVNAAKNKISAGKVTNSFDAIDATDVKNAVKDVDAIDVTDGKYSLLGEMTEADGKAYERFLKEGPQEGLTQAEIIGIYKADKQSALNTKSKRVVSGKSIEGASYSGLTQAQIDNIINIPKGSRPTPSSYLNEDYIDAHLAQFDDGISVIQTEWAYVRYSEINGFVGVPDDNTLFVMPKSYCDEVVSKANGNISIIETELGYPNGYFSDGGGLVRIDVEDISSLNIRMPSGNKTGANSLWIPGGKTSGGVPEAITDTIPLERANVSKIDAD